MGHRYTLVRTAGELCCCSDPWTNHKAFISERGDMAAHYPQIIVREGVDETDRNRPRGAEAPNTDGGAK